MEYAVAERPCEQEPIHIPGAIQPHGLLLVADRQTLRVVQAAGDIESWLGIPDWHGQQLAALVGGDLAARVRELADLPDSAQGPLETYAGQRRLANGLLVDASAVAAGSAGPHGDRRDTILVELEPAATQGEPASALLDRVASAATMFQRALTLDALFGVAAGLFRRLTGFDRVMVYRFNDDDSGRVVGEDRGAMLAPFLHHHFPAGDIPLQARALYVRNLARVIPDIHYTPAPLRPAFAGSAAAPLDLTDSSLRSVSPVHLRYLSNMGVTASASFSLVRDGALWGLIACHNVTPRRISYDVRVACRTLAGILSREIKGKEEAETLRQRLRLRSFEDDLVQLLSREQALEQGLAHHLDEVRLALGADGVAVLRDNEMIASGRAPPAEAIRALAAWLLAGHEPVRATDRLAEHFPPARDFAAIGSGLLSMVLSEDEPWLVLWFRAEQIETVRWAGPPQHEAGPEGELTPRTSFAEWAETVRGRSRRWTMAETETASRLRIALLEVRQNQRLHQLNTRLTALLQDKTLLLQQKEFLMGEVNHRVQNSLQLVASFLGMQARSTGNLDVRAALDEASRRMGAVGLVHRRLYRGQQIETIDAARYVEELTEDMLTTMGEEWRPHLMLSLTPMAVATERAVPMGLVLTELMINANKYAYGGAPGPIEISLTADRDRMRLVVADRGRGRQSEHRGFGSRMMAALMQQIDGQLDYEDNRPGLKAVLTARAEAS